MLEIIVTVLLTNSSFVVSSNEKQTRITERILDTCFIQVVEQAESSGRPILIHAKFKQCVLQEERKLPQS